MSKQLEPGELDYSDIQDIVLSTYRPDNIWLVPVKEKYYTPHVPEGIFLIELENLIYVKSHGLGFYRNGNTHEPVYWSFNINKFFENYWCAWAYVERLKNAA